MDDKNSVGQWCTRDKNSKKISMYPRHIFLIIGGPTGLSRFSHSKSASCHAGVELIHISDNTICNILYTAVEVRSALYCGLQLGGKPHPVFRWESPPTCTHCFQPIHITYNLNIVLVSSNSYTTQFVYSTSCQEFIYHSISISWKIGVLHLLSDCSVPGSVEMIQEWIVNWKIDTTSVGQDQIRAPWAL